jgi:LemA protein
VWEAYPDLKASQNFLQAQGRMSAIETTLNDRREFFNQSATEYNTYIRQFPPLLFAPLLGFGKRSLLVTPEELRADIPQPFPLKPR